MSCGVGAGSRTAHRRASAGLSAYGQHVGVGSSYGAFLAALGHIAARLHAIGSQAKHLTSGDPYHPMVLVCAHAGIKTGEDGPTHADPQPLQLVQENFPRGTVVTLTPWDPREMWPLVTAALHHRPAAIILNERPAALVKTTLVKKWEMGVALELFVNDGHVDPVGSR